MGGEKGNGMKGQLFTPGLPWKLTFDDNGGRGQSTRLRNNTGIIIADCYNINAGNWIVTLANSPRVPVAPNPSLPEIDKLILIAAAARNFVAQKGRHNTQIAYDRLVNALKDAA